MEKVKRDVSTAFAKDYKAIKLTKITLVMLLISDLFGTNSMVLGYISIADLSEIHDQQKRMSKNSPLDKVDNFASVISEYPSNMVT